MRITVIANSKRERPSFKVALLIDEMLLRQGVETDLLDLADYKIPFCGDEEEYVLEIEMIRNKLLNADAFVMVSSETHGSFSGVLKNVLDYYGEEFSRKPIAVATASTDKSGGINASVQLQHVILGLGAYPMPVKLTVPEVQSAFDKNFQVLDPLVTQMAEQFVEELLWFSRAIWNAKQKTMSTGLKLLSKHIRMREC
ncbi:NADPH-dependent FMN reductase [Negadavirga shengliensis]|uniref:NADPH-dependent FMN reductase n=1 Tax=Negadavirga shengliensis TaxID=1389218 RepID=A0ABV9T4S7_9BACT